MQADEKRIITDEELTEIVKVAAKAGADAAMEHFKAEKLKEKRNRKDRRLHNTKLLIRHYRTFKEYVNNAVFEREESNEDALGAIEELMWEPRVTADMVVESIKRSAARTQIIINHIDGMINVYQDMCQKSNSEMKIRRSKVLYDMYISDTVYSKEQIAEMYFNDKRTVYKDIDAACKELSVLLFGIDSIN